MHIETRYRSVFPFLLTLPLLPASASAQDAPPAPAAQQKPADAKPAVTQSDLEDLRSRIDELEDELARVKRDATKPPTQTLGAFNPAITAFGNFLGRSDDRAVYLDDNPANPRVGDRMALREMELDFRAPIDPWADGVMILSVSEDEPGVYGADVEEGYVTLKKLPFSDSAPAGLKLQVGRFRPGFGRLNTIHLHDLPQSSYPRALQNVLGPEGMISDGVSGRFFLPKPGPNDSLEGTLAFLDASSAPVAGSNGNQDIAALAHVSWYHDYTDGRDLELGASGWTSGAQHQLCGLDWTYRWKPYVAGEWKSFLIGGEVFHAEEQDSALAGHATSVDIWAQHQLDQNLYVGARFDWLEELQVPGAQTRTLGAFVTYYTTEFLRFRVGVEHTSSSLAWLDSLDSLFLEVNFIYGSHPAEPYWVNR
ncbi:MAG: hypothetical protein IPJ19_13675 [Planctomycetes bacterium]|nr:hypothetical protein [Planctomycetota bacterium]